MRFSDQKIYRTFEEFEREELRRLDCAGTSVDEMIDTAFGEELNFDAASVSRSRSQDVDDDE